MFSLGSQANHWIFNSSSKLTKLREEANKKFIAVHGRGKSESHCAKHFLSPAEERILCRQYEFTLRDFCKKFQPPMPKNVVGCSFQYFKRFYLNNSIMDYHPKHIIVTCVYMACKVEEFNVSITQFVANVKGDREKATDIILNNELVLMHYLNYDLAVHSPYRAVEGFLIHIKAMCPEIHDPERFRPVIEEFLDQICFTDAFLLYSPSQIALAAVAYGANKFQETLHSYINSLLNRNSNQQEANAAKAAIKSIWAMVHNIEVPKKEQVKAIEKRLEKCRNEENNPNSLAYKRKLQEMLEEEEMETAMKYAKVQEEQMRDDEELLGVKTSGS